MTRALTTCAIVIAACAAAIALGSAPARAVDFRAVDLGVLQYEHALGPIVSYAVDVNDFGQITGYSSDTIYSSWRRATIWQPDAALALTGELHELSPLIGYPLRSAGPINNRGQFFVQGMMFTPDVPNTLIGTLAPADGMPNNVGQRASIRDDLPVRIEPDGSITPLGTLGDGSHSAELINDYGQVAGASTNRFYIWTSDAPGGTSGQMTDLGVVGARWFELVELNERGTVGISYANGWPATNFGSAFLWKPAAPNAPAGQLIDLAELLDQPVVQLLDLNDADQLLAGFFREDGQHDGYFLLTPDGTGGYARLRLDDLQITLPGGALFGGLFPTALNNHGWIVGTGRWSYDGGQTWQSHATILTEIPEPSLLSGLALGLVLLRRRR